MSGIFGYINLNNKPVARETLLSMQKPMLYWGPDGQYLWNEGSAGFGQLKLLSTPESEREHFPMLDTELGLVFMCAARVDNRAELFKLLDIPYHQQLTITDAQLIFEAYKKYDKKCLDHLLGDFTFSVYHTRENRLFVARDQHGISGLYYYQPPHSFIFACSLKGLLTLPEVPKDLNDKRLKEILYREHGDGVHTSYKHLYRLPPAHYLEITARGLKKTRYWYPSETPIRYTKDDDYYEHFRELFTETVRCRLRTTGRVGSTLSSGLDSSAVSVVAANLLKERGEKLYAYTSVPAYECTNVPKGCIADEGPLAALTAEFNGNMEHFLVDAKNISLLNSYKELVDIHDEPVIHASNYYWFKAIIEQAKINNNDMLLSAQLGNATISWPTRSFIKHNSETFFEGIHKIIKSMVSLTFTTCINYHLFNIKKRLALNSKNELLVNLKIGTSTIGEIYNNIQHYNKINIVDPTFDIRLINLMLNVKDAILFNHFDNRLMIKKGLSNIIPLHLQNTNSFGLQAFDWDNRISNEIKINDEYIFNIVNNKIFKMNSKYFSINNNMRKSSISSLLTMRYFLDEKFN